MRSAPAASRHEAHDAADLVPALSEARDLGADVEVLALYADHAQPPVTGGNSATSSPGRTGWSEGT